MRGFSIQKKLLFLSVWSLFFLLIQFTVANASPRQITYKDYLKDPGTGTPYNGTYLVEYRLYNLPTGGTVQFCEIQSATIDNGNIFSHIGKATTGGIPDLVFCLLMKTICRWRWERVCQAVPVQTRLTAPRVFTPALLI